MRNLTGTGESDSKRQLPHYLSYPGVPDVLRVQQLCCSVGNCYILQKGKETQAFTDFFLPQALCHTPHKTNPSSGCVWAPIHTESKLCYKWSDTRLTFPKSQPLTSPSAPKWENTLTCSQKGPAVPQLRSLTEWADPWHLWKVKGSGGRCSKTLLENLELWGKLLCHPPRIIR